MRPLQSASVQHVPPPMHDDPQVREPLAHAHVPPAVGQTIPPLQSPLVQQLVDEMHDDVALQSFAPLGHAHAPPAPGQTMPPVQSDALQHFADGMHPDPHGFDPPTHAHDPLPSQTLPSVHATRHVPEKHFWHATAEQSPSVLHVPAGVESVNEPSP